MHPAAERLEGDDGVGVLNHLHLLAKWLMSVSLRYSLTSRANRRRWNDLEAISPASALATT
jgi:hypothetical protein